MEKLIVTRENLSDGIDNVRAFLTKYKVNRKDVARCILSIEDITEALLKNNPNGSAVIKMNSFLGRLDIKIIAEGEPIALTDIQGLYQDDSSEDEEYNAIVRRFMSQIIGANISIKNSQGSNICSIAVARSKYIGLINAITALVLGILVGFALKLLAPEAIANFISVNIFSSISTVFMNAIKMIVGPLVLFSMAASVAEFTDLRALGRIASKVLLGYVCTSVIAIAIGYFTYSVFPIGDTALASCVTDAASATVAAGESTTVSLKDTVVGVVPSTFAEPFVDNDMLQIIFIGILIGIGVGAISEKYPLATEGLQCLNSLFSKITAIIIGFLPIAVFCSMGSMVIGMDTSNLLKVAVWIPVNYVGDILMLCVYCLILLIVGRLNPIAFLQNFAPAMFTAFSTNSSNATMPQSMICCDERLGINRKVYSFSIPLGATINMDGSCINLVITMMFMAKIFGVSLTGSILVSMFVTIMLLSIGAPGVPGGNLVCMVMLLPQLGMPAEAVSIIMGIYTISAMGQTTVNVTGDATISTLVAKSEKLLDLGVYYGKKE